MLKKIVRIFYRAPDFKVGGENNPYMLRWWVIPRNNIFNIYLHKFLRDDDDRALHDHPWKSLSIILWGGYIEWTFADPALGARGGLKKKTRWPGMMVTRKATDAHRIQLHGNDPKKRHTAWTLFITGPWERTWGFHCPKRWMQWRDFVNLKNTGEVGPGCGD